METVYLFEKKVISLFFNPLKDTVFLLTNEYNKLDLVEENLSTRVIIKRFKILKQNDLNTTSNICKKLPKETFEGYSLYFWEKYENLIMTFPSGYILIYEYNSGQLKSHFQARGKYPYIVRNIIGSPIDNTLFFSAELKKNIYCLNYDIITKCESNNKLNNYLNIIYSKLILPKMVTVYDIICHPNEKFVFVGCSDSIIRVYNYSNLKEVNMNLVDVDLSSDNKILKNQQELIKNRNILKIYSLDINKYGNYLLSGNENGYIYLWDAFSAIKGIRKLLTKEKLSIGGIYSSKFLELKQFEQLNRFICLTKEGKVYICSINDIEKSSKSVDNNNFNEYKKNSKSYYINKKYVVNRFYENSIFNPIYYDLNKYNIITNSFINYSSNSSLVSIKWPYLRIDKSKTPNLESNTKEENLILLYYTSKCFFIYDNIYPKINLPVCNQLLYPNYTDLIPASSNIIKFEQYFYICDNYFIYQYDISKGILKKLINYAKEFDIKSSIPLKFEVRPRKKQINYNLTNLNTLVLLQRTSSCKSLIYFKYNLITTNIIKKEIFNNVIDFLVLGEEDNEIINILMIDQNKQTCIIYNFNDNNSISKSIEGNVLRVYWTPFCSGYSVLYRNVLNQLKFSENICLSKYHGEKDNKDFSIYLKNNVINLNLSDVKNENKIDSNFDCIKSNKVINNQSINLENTSNIQFDENITKNNFNNSFFKEQIFNFKNECKTSFYLDFSEREVDIKWSYCKNINNNLNDSNLIQYNSYLCNYLCAISMIEKIVICNYQLEQLYVIKIPLIESPNIICSMYWIGTTLLYSKGNSIYYYYPNDNICQKIFTNDKPHTVISGVLADRLILVNKLWGSKKIESVSITTPIVSPLEPIIIGYLDIPNIDYQFLKEAILNMFSNQVSDLLINKLLNRNLKELAYYILKDSKSSYPNLKAKLSISNDLLNYKNTLDILFPNIEFKNSVQIEDLIWQFCYNHNYEHLKNLINNQIDILVSHGQYLSSINLLELVSDYTKLASIMLYSANYQNFISLIKILVDKNKFSYSEAILNSNFYCCSRSRLLNYSVINNFIKSKYSNSIKKSNLIKQKVLSINIFDELDGTNNVENSENYLNELNYSKVFDNYKGEPLILNTLNNLDNKTSCNIAGLEKRINKKNSHISDIKQKNLTFGEHAFDQFVEVFNNDTKKYELVSINHLSQQKIEHFYGYNNYIGTTTNKKINDFYDASVPLVKLKDNTCIVNNNDFSLNNSLEEIDENLYLNLYLRCDKGYGFLVEDISNNSNTAIITITNPTTNEYNTLYTNVITDFNIYQEANENEENDNNKTNDDKNYDKLVWSLPLEENNPLELDDKWGRKSTQSHSIIFDETLNTSLTIKHNNSLNNFSNHFSFEVWIKPKVISGVIFKKETLLVYIINSEIAIEYLNKQVTLTSCYETSDIGCNYNNLSDNTYIKNENKLKINKWQHLCIKYSVNKGYIYVLLNGIETKKGVLKLNSNINNLGDIIIGNGKLNAEITEIRLWNKNLPNKIIKENMKCPLAILSENKRKLNKVKIGNANSVSKKNEQNKKFQFKGVSSFGISNNNNINLDSNSKNENKSNCNDKGQNKQSNIVSDNNDFKIDNFDF